MPTAENPNQSTPSPSPAQPQTAAPAQTPATTTPSTPSPSAATPAAATPGQSDQTPATDLTQDKSKVDSPAEPTGTDLGAEPPAEGDKPADAPKANEYHGAPEGDYADLQAPDGFVVDEALKAEFTPIAKELDLSPKGVEKLMGFKAELDKRQITNWGNHLKELKATAQADPEIGGAKYQPAVQAAIQARDKFGTPGFRKMLNDYGVGAHPEMIRFLSKVQAAVGEIPSLGNGDGPGTTNKPLHEILYKDV